MINTVILDNEIKVWWEYKRISQAEEFKVKLNGQEIGATKLSHYNIVNLTPNTNYQIEVEIVDSQGIKKEQLGNTKVQTLVSKRKIDVSKPPYNAKGDGKTLNTKAIQEAIDDCGENDCVYFPDGEYLSGALELRSDVELYLSEGATLQGSANEKDYLPKVKSRFEGCVETCYRSLLNAGKMDAKGGINCENITIRGGKIIGGGQALRKSIINAERPRVLKENGLHKEINPPFYYATVLPGRTRGRLLGFNNVKNVLIANCVTGNSPSWNLHFTYCENVVTCGGKIVSHKISNGDGWDPDSSNNCILFDTEFDTGDDCVAIKSGKNLEGYLVGRPSKRIRVFDCVAIDGHGIAIGSEMSGGIEDVVIWNCDISAGAGIYIKSAKERGGYVKNVKFYNCSVPTVSVCLGFNLNPGENPAPNNPQIYDLTFEHLELTGVGRFTGEHERVEPETAFRIKGLDKENPIKDVNINNITLKYRQMIPNQTLLFKNVKNVRLKNIISKGEI